MRIRNLALALAGLVTLRASTDIRIPYTIQTVAGGSSVGDGGLATSAPLSAAEGIARDRAGNLFIADASDHRIRKITPDGHIFTVAGDGFPGFRGDGGPAGAARLNAPYGIALDDAGNLYIADLGNHRVRRIDPEGVITTVAGSETLESPRNVALDGAGGLYVSEFTGQRVRRIGPDGALSTVAGNGTAGFAGDGGAATDASLSFPAGLAFDASGNLYIADSGNHRVRKVSAGIISTVLEQLILPTGVAVDVLGNLFVADSGNQLVERLGPGGDIATLPGSGRDLAADDTGNLYIASGPHVLQLSTNAEITTIAGDSSYHFRGDGGDALSARLNSPTALAVDSTGVIYIVDQQNQRVRKVDADGVITTAMGMGASTPEASELSTPAGIGLNKLGDLYVSDRNNHRIQMLISGDIVVTAAGTGVAGFNGDGISAQQAQISSPGPMAQGRDGTLYFVDEGNRRVRRLSPNGVVTTAAQVSARGLTVDASDRLYLSASDSNTILRVGADGKTTVVAGSATAGFSGDEGLATAAQLSSPAGLAVDAQGNLYIADSGNNRIRMVGPDGIIHTVAGNGAADFGGDGGPALLAALHAPVGVVTDSSGNLWIADTGNNRIRQLSPIAIAEETAARLSAVNAASLRAGPIAPGEIVSIFGAGLGPEPTVLGSPDAAGDFPREVAEVKVLFDGRPAPLFYVQAQQINAQAPRDISGKSTVEVEIFYRGTSRGKLTVPVAAAAPGVFTIGAGKGQARALNADGSSNSESKPAMRATFVTLYATGEGLTHRAGTEETPVLPVTLTLGGYMAQIQFARAAPGFSGMLEIKARVPGGFAPTGNIEVVLQVGDAISQKGVTIAVR
jgi:uncharacterized protein (TIGR03437 family)